MVSVKRLAAKFTDREITPLHLAVIRQKPDIAAVLLDKGADPNARDKFGWTPLHYAACLTDAATYLLLQKRKADPQARTYLGMTCDQLRTHRGLAPSIWSQGKIFVREGEEKHMVDLSSPEDVENHLGLKRYTDEFLFSEEQLALATENNQRASVLPSESLHKMFYKKRAVLKQNPPLLCIEQAPHLQVLGNPLCSRGVVAGQDLKSGDPVGIYAGRVVQTDQATHFEDLLIEGLKEVEDNFQFCTNLSLNVDPRQEGNAMRFINDDFPNCWMMGDDLLVTTLCDIKEGESLSVDYSIGQLPLKWGRYLLGKKEELTAYFKAHPLQSLENILKAQKNVPLTESDFFHMMDQRQKCLYVYHTPAAVIYASLSQSISPLEMLRALINPEHAEMFNMKAHDQYYCWIATTLVILQHLEALLPQTGPELEGEIRAFLLEQLRMFLTMTQMVQTLHLVARRGCPWQPDYTKEKVGCFKGKDTPRDALFCMASRQPVHFTSHRSSQLKISMQPALPYPVLDRLLRQMGVIG